MKKGKVWLVGAGPGDIGLFTLKGAAVLQQADVVVYDSLVGEGVLAKIPEHARLINVGKRANHHTMVQEDINKVLLEEAEKGNKVVRLKGGDPFLFGRGGEELELLSENGIPYEIVPGVTSPISVPAYNGIPVTHRDFCSSLHIITGHKRAGQEYDIDFKALTQTKGTLVFLMGIAALEDICKGLLAGGMDPNVPAAVLQKGTTAGQKRVVATVGTLKEEVDRQGIETPAIIVVGKVCSLADKFAWYEKLPLAGWKVLVTRPRQHISKTADLLRQKGAEVLELPSICTVPVEDNGRLYEAFEKLDTYQWIIFTSPAGVEIFFDEMDRKEMDVRSLGQAKIAVIGEGTKKKLKEHHLLADFVPDVYDGDTLGAELAKELQGNEKIETAIAALQQETTEEMLAHVLTIIRRSMKENKQLIIAVEPPKGDGKINLQTIRTNDGKQWLAAFTSFDEELKGSDKIMSTFTAEIDKIFLTALQEPSIEGVIINPWNRTIMLNKSLINIILGNPV